MEQLDSPSGLRLITAPTGANESTQYVAVVGYDSLLGAQAETIKIEVGLREPLLLAAERRSARTLLLNPISGAEFVPPSAATCLAFPEAMAEKLRAALSRREVAIRDFFDVDHAVTRLGVRVDDPTFLALVREKLQVPGNDPVDVSPSRFDDLQRQLDSQLKPVLRDVDLDQFNLERAFRSVAEVAARVAE